jgi:hypothetical protein
LRARRKRPANPYIALQRVLSRAKRYILEPRSSADHNAFMQNETERNLRLVHFSGPNLCVTLTTRIAVSVRGFRVSAPPRTARRGQVTRNLEMGVNIEDVQILEQNMLLLGRGLCRLPFAFTPAGDRLREEIFWLNLSRPIGGDSPI